MVEFSVAINKIVKESVAGAVRLLRRWRCIQDDGDVDPYR